jgi:hypothetical protein
MTDEVARLGGWLDCWEDSNEFTGICLTFEFGDAAQANVAVHALRRQGERIDTPPRPYGD